MRKILISKQNEFSYNTKSGQSRALAVKMFASLIKAHDKANDDRNSHVVVSNKRIKTELK